MKYTTEQEEFWADSKWGHEYIERNGPSRIKNEIALFSKILSATSKIESAIEFGANIGNNISAITTVTPGMKIDAIEINSEAADLLSQNNLVDNVFRQSIFEFEPTRLYDLAFIKGVLIHVAPNMLENVYKKLYSCSSKYILIAEYYSPSPVSCTYRGHKEKLYKRDFAGEIMDLFTDLKLVDYGFVYHRDNNFPQDDITWFLLEKI